MGYYRKRVFVCGCGYAFHAKNNKTEPVCKMCGSLVKIPPTNQKTKIGILGRLKSYATFFKKNISKNCEGDFDMEDNENKQKTAKTKQKIEEKEEMLEENAEEAAEEKEEAAEEATEEKEESVEESVEEKEDKEIQQKIKGDEIGAKKRKYNKKHPDEFGDDSAEDGYSAFFGR